MKTILKSIKELTIEITAKKQQLYNKVFIQNSLVNGKVLELNILYLAK